MSASQSKNLVGSNYRQSWEPQSSCYESTARRDLSRHLSTQVEWGFAHLDLYASYRLRLGGPHGGGLLDDLLDGLTAER